MGGHQPSKSSSQYLTESFRLRRPSCAVIAYRTTDSASSDVVVTICDYKYRSSHCSTKLLLTSSIIGRSLAEMQLLSFIVLSLIGKGRPLVFVSMSQLHQPHLRLHFVGVQMVAGAAKQCYGCSGDKCKDPFNPSANGVIKVNATNGWCTVSDIDRHWLSFGDTIRLMLIGLYL